MNFRSRKPLFYVLGLIFVTFFSSSFAQDFSQVQIKSEKVTDGVYMLTVYGIIGGNIGVSVGEDGILLIDTQIAQVYEKIKEALAEIDSDPVRFVVNTHFHFDHSGGNEPFGKNGALILGHEIARKRMKQEWSHWFSDTKIPPSSEIALPAVTFADSMTLHLNGDDILLYHLEKAHSGTDTIVFFRKANVVHMGDLYFAGGYPFIDVPHGGSTKGYIEALDSVITMIDEETKVIPGHGPLSNIEELQTYRNMLSTVYDRILSLVEEDKTIEEVLDAQPTADFDKDFNRQVPAEALVRIIYEDISKR